MRAQRNGRVRFAIAPGSVSEARVLGNEEVKKKLLAVMTNKAWKRLMPDTFLEAEEIRAAVIKARPDWAQKNAVDNAYLQSSFYFRRSKGGFWDVARDGKPLPVTNESLREERDNSLARQEVREIRDVFKNGSQAAADKNLQEIKLDLYDGDEKALTVDYWRGASAYHLIEELKVFASPYSEFLDRYIDTGAMFEDMGDFYRLWYEVLQPADLKRQWLRTTMEYLQRWHKPTSGSPADSLLAVHMLDAEYFVTADKNFAKCLMKIYREAPFSAGMPLLVAAGRESVDELIHFISRG